MRGYNLPAICTLIVLAASILASGPAWSAATNVEADKLWDFANGLYIRGRTFYSEAEQQYREFLKKYPDDPRVATATFRLAECYRLQGKYKEAYETYLANLKLDDPENREKVEFRTGQVLFQLGKYTESAKQLEPLYKKELDGDIKDLTAFYYGRALIESGSPDEGVKILEPLASDSKNRFSVFASYHIANAWMKAGKPEPALAYLEPVAKSESSLAPEAQFRLGELHLKLKKYDQAVTDYEDLIKRFPDSGYVPFAAYGIIWGQYASGDYKDCIAKYSKFGALVDERVKAEVIYLVGNSQYETGQYKKAIELYLSIPKFFPESPYVSKARYKTTWALFMLKDYEQAISYAGSYLEDNPDAEDADQLRFLSGESYLAMSNFKKAGTEFDIVVSKFPESVFYQDSIYKLGWCELQQKDYLNARKHFRDLAEKYPDHSRAPESLVRAAECCVTLAGTKKDPAEKKALSHEAARDYETFLQKYPENDAREEVLYQLAIIYTGIGENDKAIEKFQFLVADFPDGKYSADAHYWIARAFHKSTDIDKAIPAYENAIKAAKPGKFRERAQYQLASIYHEKGEMDKAAGVLIPLLTSNPDFEVPQETYMWAADYLREKAKYGDAAKMYSNFVRKHPQSTLCEAAYFGLGECSFAKEDMEAAIENYAKAVDLKGPSYVLARISLGVAYARAGQHDKARPILTDMSKGHTPEIEARAIFWLGNMLYREAGKEATQEARIDKYNKARLEFIKIDILYTKSEFRPESMYRVAETLEYAGETSEAIDEYKKIVEEYPDTEFGKNAKTKLEENQST